MLFLLAALACTDADKDSAADAAELPWSPPDGPGPYDVGFTTLEHVDARGKTLIIEVWYPAIQEDGVEPDAYEPTILTGDGVRDADPERIGAPWPLVAFSHGFGGIRFQSVFLTERLASHGFVVVAPDHNLNTLLDLDEDASAQVMLERPDDIRNAIDHIIDLSAADDALLGGMVDGPKEDVVYASTGHSFGAVTALTVGGGELNYQGLLDYCGGGGDSRACEYLDAIDPSVIYDYGANDPRAQVTIPMSPGIWYAFGGGGEGLAAVREPTILGGTLDDVTEYEAEILPTYEYLSSPKTLFTFADAGHYAFSDICRLAPILSDECGGVEDGFIDLDRAQYLTNILVTATLGVQLAGDDRYAPWLEAEAVAEFPEITMDSAR